MPQPCQLAQAGADVGPRDAQRRADLLGMRGRGERNSSAWICATVRLIAPAGAHLAPVEDEFLLDSGERGRLRSVHFC